MSVLDKIEGKTLEADAAWVNGELIVNVTLPDEITEDEYDDAETELMHVRTVVTVHAQ